jgi:L-ascorbate metabolism protein UlaG (beta-lactamase superfamily)
MSGMRLTKFTHACVRLDDGGRTLVFDPGQFSEATEALAGANAILITHEHIDHIDEPAIKSALAGNAELHAWAPRVVIDAHFSDVADRFTATQAGQSFEAAGFRVTTHGGQHAVIHPLVPVITNVGYLVDGNVYHPGDSFAVPAQKVKTLLVPVHAPWNKVSEVIDFIIAVRPERAHQIHDGLLNELGAGFIKNNVTRLADQYGVSFSMLAPKESVEV